VSIEGNTIKCDACGRERRMAATSAAEIEDLPDAVKRTYEKLGIPEAERTYRSGVTAQAAARKLGWKSVGESDYCPDCA
jgi:Fe-S cluster assembly scaffold protein SufB